MIFYQYGRTYEAIPDMNDANAEVICEVDENLFTHRFMDLIMKEH